MNTVVYCGYGWASNIGNAFIDYGLRYQIEAACPWLSLYHLANTNAYLKSRYTRRFPYSLFNRNAPAANFDLRTWIQADAVILGGSLLTDYWFTFNRQFLDFLRESRIRVVLLGAGGGNTYNSAQVACVREVLKSINLHALVTRDEPTFEAYHDLAPIAYNGIDNAMFLADCFRPMPLAKNGYTVLTFDDIPEPKGLPIPPGSTVIRTFHPSAQLGQLAHLIRRPWTMLRLAGKRHLISDFPDDYLHLYANAACTFSDRVHACVATLVFGGAAQLFSCSARAHLFERVGLGGVTKGQIRLGTGMLDDEKRRQLDVVRTIFEA